MRFGKGKKMMMRNTWKKRVSELETSRGRAREKDSFIFVVCSFIVLGLLA